MTWVAVLACNHAHLLDAGSISSIREHGHCLGRQRCAVIMRVQGFSFLGPTLAALGVPIAASSESICRDTESLQMLHSNYATAQRR